jgi:uncharacterized repeat protein (TIGR01451 family)
MRVRFALSAICLCLGSAPMHAELSLSAGASGVPPAVAPEGLILYDQLSSPAGNGAPDQNFEAAQDAFDSEAADDFVVTDAGGWDITGINTVGTTGAAGGATVDVTFHANAPGGGDPDLPGAAECTYAALVPGDIGGSLTITLPSTCSLAQGTHWVAIVVNQNFGTHGQHFWANRTVQNGSEGVFRNPANGFGTGCTTFTPQTICGVGGGAAPDFLFQVVGQVGQAGPAADLGITKTGLASPGSIVYTITVTNNGPAPATGVTVTDPLPPQLAYVSDDCGGSNVPPWTWNIGPLAASASAVCNVTLSVVTPGAVSNTATVDGAEADPTPGNDSATATNTVTGGGSIVEIPSLSPLGLGMLALLLGGGAMILLRRRRA